MEFAFLALVLIFLYICTFALYYLFVAFVSKDRRRFVRNGRYSTVNYYNNLVVVIYAHNAEKDVSALLEKLNRQKYPKENYKIYIILDNCTDNSSNRLETIGGANIFRVGESFTVGKDDSISQLLDRLISFKNINAYVFLGVDRSIDENFLSSINQGLLNHDVLVGSTVLMNEPDTLKRKIISAYNIYENNILNTSRSILGLSTLINSDCCVIKQNVIEKVQCIDFKDINSELKYSVMLSKLNYKSSFDPNVVTYLNGENYNVRKASFSYRISLLKNSLPILLKSGFLFNEFVLASIQPSVPVLIALMSFYAWLIMSFDIDRPFGYVLNPLVYMTLLAVLCGSFLFTLTNSKLQLKEIPYLLLYPVYSTLLLIRKCPVIKQIFDLIDKIKNPVKVEKHSVPVVVAAGDKKMDCRIDLIEESGMIKAVFVFKNKKQSTDLHLRVYDAIKSISTMLSEKEYEIVDPETKEVVERGNFDLRICQNCKYFTTKIDGTINVIKGSCSCAAANEEGLEKLVMLWQCCENYAPSREKIVDLKNFRKDN